MPKANAESRGVEQINGKMTGKEKKKEWYNQKYGSARVAHDGAVGEQCARAPPRRPARFPGRNGAMNHGVQRAHAVGDSSDFKFTPLPVSKPLRATEPRLSVDRARNTGAVNDFLLAKSSVKQS